MERFTPDIHLRPVDFDPFAEGAIACTVPSTEPQREVFIASSMDSEASCAYNESVSLELTGPLDRTAMEGAIRLLVERHEGLRSVMAANGTRAIVLEHLDIPLGFTDLSALGEGERAERLAAIAEADMTTPFDVVHGPLFRAQLIRTAPDAHLLRLTGHHVICDGWSLGIVMADISRLYSALATGTAPQLPPAVPFSTYALATIGFAKSEEHARVERFWLDRFSGPLPRLDLPTDRPRPKQKTYPGHRLDVPLDPQLVRGLKEVATRSGSSFVTTLLTTFELLLHKLTGTTDLVVGLPAAGQSDLGMKDLVGHCVNLLALRSQVDGSVPFIEHLKARRSAVLDAFDHQKYTFGTLVRRLNVPREPGRIPLVPVVFNIDMNMDDGVRFTGLRHRFVSNPRRYEQFELFLNATGHDEHLVLEWSYNTDLFDAATVRGWADELARLIARIQERPAAPIRDLLAGGGAPASTEHLPPEAWLGQAPAYPRGSGIGALFAAVVAQHGDRIAVEINDRTLRYSELQQRVHALAEQLVAAGVKPGDPVGLCVDRGFEMVTAMLAILHCGGCFVPLDPAYPADRLQFMFDDTRVRVLLTQRHLKDALPAHQAKTLLLEDTSARARTIIPPAGGPDDAAYIMYTSGSTGRPKGVVVPHRAIVRLVREQDFLPFGPELVFLQLSNISFDASTLEIWGALLNGGRLVLQPQQKPTLQEITATIHEKGVTTVWFTAGVFNLLVDDHLERLRGLRHILTGGDVLSVPHVKKALQALGPGVLINGYGPTENTTFTCCHAIDDAARIKGSVPIGRPIHNTRVHVLDEALRPVPIGRTGELYAGGDGVALGYWDRPDLTAERFLPDPFSNTPGALLYRTGDLVRWTEDGLIEFIGRADGQVKVRGFRIELGEIENALNGHPLVKDRVVIARSDMGAEKQLVCYVVPSATHHLGDPAEQERLIAAVREHLRAELPEYMVPTAFVVMAGLPLNPNGKVDKKALPAPEFRAQTTQTQFIAPRTHLERMLAGIWSHLLGVEKIGVHDNFFDLGGHSLIGIQLLAQVDDQLKKSHSLKALFQAPTIAEFAKLLEDEGASVEWENLSPIQPEGTKVPFFCVHGDEANYFIPRYLGNDQPFYAFFHQGEDGKPIRHTQVELIAEHFIREMRTVRPEGPYLLSGYSFGGIVAFEMAQQLMAAGHEVALLALLDTYEPTAFIRTMREEAKWYDGLKKKALRWMVRRYMRRGQPLPPKLRHFYIIDTYDFAIRDYRPRPYAGTVTLFRAQDSTGPEEMGWGALGRVRVHIIPGDHYSMVKEPQVRILANELGLVIDKAIATQAVEAV